MGFLYKEGTGDNDSQQYQYGSLQYTLWAEAA